MKVLSYSQHVPLTGVPGFTKYPITVLFKNEEEK